jgi:hypothetical protein
MARRWLRAFLIALLAAGSTFAAPARKRPYRLPDTDLKQRVIWGAVCERPDGTGLAFGGQDQQADDGRPHTRIKVNGRWTCIRDELRAANPLETFHDRLWEIRNEYRHILARVRALHFKGLPAAEVRQRVEGDLDRRWTETIRALARLDTDLAEVRGLGEYPTHQAAWARGLLDLAKMFYEDAEGLLEACMKAPNLAALQRALVDLEGAAEMLDAEPPPRALSPIVYEPKRGVYVLFGGDHLDYLMNDTWVFDPKQRRWLERHPSAGAPPPRANHTLEAPGDGTVVVSGGYAYASNTDYCGGQYVDLDDGKWEYHVPADHWSPDSGNTSSNIRTYRAGPFRPKYFLLRRPPEGVAPPYGLQVGPLPDAAAQEKVLASLPINQWILLEPPRVPRLNRDWGTVRLDPDHDMILVWSGGHSAHGGTDVLHYHLSTNRWELPYPVEFPLGQLYANTRYPDGFNFNRRPWVTGHTYQSYEYDPLSKRLLFTGRPTYTYLYDPEVAEWVGRAGKPPDMIYNSCFYTLTLCATPRGVICWGQGPRRERGRIHRYDKRKGWIAVELKGDLPEPRVDHSTLGYDSRRDRLLLLCCDYGKKPNGQVWELDLATMAARPLNPVNMAAAAGKAYQIDRVCYVPDADLMLLCTLLPGGDGDLRRHVAYDCERNQWVSLRLNHETDKRGPLAPTAVRRSVGLVYDARRKLIWGVDTNRVRVFVLRFDAKEAGIEPMKK